MGKKLNLDLKQIFLLGGIFLLIIILWNTFVVYPLKIFVVLLHELGHGLAAILTGGRMVRIELSPGQGGTCWSSGGIRWLVLPAGYLGSMLLGGIILLLASRMKIWKAISTAIGVIVLLLTVFFIRSLFGVIFCVIFGGVMVLLGLKAPKQINALVLKTIGLTSILYALFDIRDDLIVRTVPSSDAYSMSEIFPLPPVVWGILWAIAALIAAVFFLGIAAARQAGETSTTGEGI